MRPSEVLVQFYARLEAGDLMSAVGLLDRDVRWAVNAQDRSAAPWFGIYQGRREVLNFLEAIATVEFDVLKLLQVVDGENLAIGLFEVEFRGPSGAQVAMLETQVWRFKASKVCSVDILLDTAAVGAAFS